MAQDTSTIYKGYKVTNLFRKRLIGVACKNLDELKLKGCQKLQLEADIKHIKVVLGDGTIVDDDSYFKTLPSQSIVILLKPGEKIVTGVDIIYGALKTFNIELLETASKVKQFFDDDAQKKIKLLSRFFKNEEDKKRASLSRRSDDPEWFEDLETFAETKEDFMRKRSSGRIQRYFYDTKDKIRNSHLYLENISARQSLNSLLQNFYERLKRDEFFAYYFDRTCSKGAICDNSGLFVCQGLWNNDMCSYIAGDIESDHQINPYTSKEQRVIFCTWNLDHRIERSRNIIPSLIKASEICYRNSNYQINSEYFYDLLFTLKNLKFVHIVCHDKNEHKSAICDFKRIVIKEPFTSERRNKTRFASTLKNSINGVQLKRHKRVSEIYK